MLFTRIRNYWKIAIILPSLINASDYLKMIDKTVSTSAVARNFLNEDKRGVDIFSAIIHPGVA